MKIVKPTPRPSVSEFAITHRVLSRDDTREHGKYRFTRALYQRDMMDIINKRGVRRIVCMLSAQMGKSLILMNILMYMIVIRPCTMLFMLPSLKMAKKFSKFRFTPMLRDNPILHDKIPPKAKRGNTVTEKEFPGGGLMIVGSNAADDLSSTPAGAAFVDEYDRCAREAVNAAGEKEGDPLMLLWKRLSNMGPAAFLYICGTPTIKGASATEDLWEESNKMLYMIPCPDCGTYQFLSQERLKWDGKEEGENEHPKTAYFKCSKTNCNAKLTQGTLFKSYYEKTSKWVENRESDGEIAGFHINQFYSPWRRCDDIVKEIIDSRGHPAKEKVVQNTVWGLPYELTSIQTPDWKKLYNLKGDFKSGIVPAEACVITAFTDVQQDRFETTVFAWNRNKSWVVDHIITRGSSVWDLDDEMYEDYEKTVLEASWKHENGRMMRPRHFYMDTGHFASRLLKFCQKHKGKLIPTRGEDRLDTTFSTPKKTSINFYGKRLKTGIKRWNLGVSEIKIDLYARLNLMIYGQGDDQGLKIHFNKNLPEEYFKQLVAEVCYVEHDRWGRPKYHWDMKNYHVNEALDCAVGNLAVFAIEGYDRWSDRHWEAEVRKFCSISENNRPTKKYKERKPFSMI